MDSLVMPASKVLELLAQPVWVDELGDIHDQGIALLNAWSARVPMYGLSTSAPVGVGVLMLEVSVEWLTNESEDSAVEVSRSGVVKFMRGDDPWDAYMLALVRASSVWGLKLRVRTLEDDAVMRMLES